MKKIHLSKKLVLSVAGLLLIGIFFTLLYYFGYFFPNQSLNNRPKIGYSNHQTKTKTNNHFSNENSNQPKTSNKECFNYEKAVINSVKKVSDSVVSIIISKDLPVIEQRYYDPFSDLPPEFRQFFEPFKISQPQIKGKRKQEIGGGSGFIISSDGLVLTNKHVVMDKSADYTVLTNDGEKYKAKIVAVHPTLDVAVLRIKPRKKLKPVELGNSDDLQLGQTVIAIGNALGEFRNTVSKGIVSGLRRNITASGESMVEEIKGVIQTDAAINKGNSGGPLIDLDGKVVGVNVAMASGAQSIGFAIPINQVKSVISSVKTRGKIVIPFLGVRYININKEFAKKEKLSVNYGALLRGDKNGPAIIPGSAAEKAGLRAEDIILEVNGEKLDKHTLSELISKYKPGQVITLKVLRKKQTLYVRAKLGEKEF